jgi:two-component system, response regulator PdtaR
MPAPKNTVLLCDDDRLVLATVSSGLRAAGYEVVEADNGDDAILLARQHRPLLAVLDMRMNGKSGLDVAAYLRDYVGTPFIFLSAFGDEEIMREARGFGALDYLVKPMDSRRIVSAVEAALRKVSQGQQPADSAAAAESRVSGDASLSRPPEVSIALGILMERFRITRAAAEDRLAKLGAQSGRGREAVATDLVMKFDELHQAPVSDSAPKA